jgi:hypothetical protein
MLPNVNFNVQDNLQALPVANANSQIKVGVCSDGIVGQVYQVSTTATLTASLGQGPLVEATAIVLDAAGGPVLCLPINPSSFGTASSVTHTGTGTGTVTVSEAPRVPVQLKIILGGASGTYTYALSVNGSVYGPTITSAAGANTVPVPGTLTTLTLSDQTYTTGAVWTISVLGVITLVGTGTVGWVTQQSSPLDTYAAVVNIVAAGGLGAGQFQYSMDGNNTTSGTILIPSGAAYAIPNTGVVVTFGGTFTALDAYSFATTTAGFNASDVSAAGAVAIASPISWNWLHLVGEASNSSGAVTIGGTLDTLMTTAFMAYIFVFAILEVPDVEIDTTILTNFVNFVSYRVSAAVGYCALQSPLATSRVEKRNIAWPYAGRLGLIPPGESAGWVGRGALPRVLALYPNFGSTVWDPTALDAGRFTTGRTIQDEAGFFMTRGNMMAPQGSQFARVQDRRVMDVACAITRAAELPYLEGNMRVDPTTGFIDPRDASGFEGVVNTALKNSLVNTKNASGASVAVDRTTDILDTNNLPVAVSIVKLVTLEQITNNIGFSNPAAGG